MHGHADVTVDVAIVGGGIAGAALATVLARDGYQVLLLERQTTYRDKVRGEVGTAMTVSVNGLSFHVVDEGSGPPVLLLHGFPDSPALWRHQIPAIVDAGHRVIAPDLRGFGASDRPEGVAECAMPRITGAGHWIPLDAPEELAALLVDFLR